MGQAASMCRFRGCRYKKNKTNKNTTGTATTTTTTANSATTAATAATTPTNTANSSPVSGLQLRSIEEPSAQCHQTQTHHYHHTGRMPAAEQGGTGCVSFENANALNQRTGVPLQLQTTQNQYHHHQQPQQNPHTMQHTTQKGYDAEQARMEAWMDENQEFVQDYFIRKATRQVVDAWLVSHATTAGNDVSLTGSPTHTNGQSCSSRGGSGATTPVRKISAHEFERGGLLKPIVNTIDGTPTFLSVGTQNDCSTNSSNMGGIGGGSNGNNIGASNGNYNAANGTSTLGAHHYHHHHHGQTAHSFGTMGYYRPQRLSRNELKALDEKELIFELVKDICNELEVRTLCHKILQNVSILLNADRGSLFLVQGRCNTANDGPKKCLVSKLFDVCPRSTVEEMEQQEEVRVAWGSGIAGHVAESGEPVNIPDAYQDERFNGEIDSITGYRTKALLCMPIKDSSGDVIGVAQVINKLNGECFTEADEKVFASYLQFCGIGLRNAQLYEKSQLEIKRNQVLLDLARMIFEEQSTIEHMVFRILTHMQSLIQCQRVQILLLHEASKGSFSRVFDFEANDLSEEENTSRTSPHESRFPINVGITGYVATTGETVNIPNAYEDDRFDANVDIEGNFKHKSILCMAIKNSLGQIIGVIQLINKFDDLNFTKNDENFVEAFAIFCGMGIHNTHMYEKAIVAMAKQSVTLEVLSYHASATIDEAHRLRRLRVPSAAHFRLHDFRFDDIHFEDDDTLKACLRMFLDLDFVERFHIDYEVLCRWLLSVKKNYRNVTYHNWRHAFNVAQMMFAILTISHNGQATQWWKIFGEIECLALIIGCLCHDLDHRGTNNSFQIKASSPLAQLYSTSTMEHHHFDQCLMILNSPGNQILANLSSDDYCRVIRVLEDAILSTDLAVYFRKRGPFLQSVKEQPLSYWEADEPRALLRAMSMTVCDLSAITKPWDIEKRVADLVSSEFFEQGDMEKQELNIMPIDIMNREKEDELPMMQVNFIESICLPIYEAFADLSDKLEPLVEGVRENREHWIELAQQVQNKENAASNTNGCADTTKQNGCISDGRSDLTDEIGTTNTTNCDSNADDGISTGAECEIDEQSDSKNPKEINNCNNDNDDNDEDDAHLCAEEEEAAIEADDDDSDVEASRHSNGCFSSGSSGLSTPPPTGEDDSLPTSPAKTTQAKLIAANLNSLNQRTLKSTRNCCRSCEYVRCSGNMRKASSLKGAKELQQQLNTQNGGSCGYYSRSAPSVSSCGVTSSAASLQKQQNHSDSQPNQLQHHHHHHHHRHHSHQHHHHHHHHNNNKHAAHSGNGATGNTSSGAESDRIPKIVGKLGNIDSLQYLASGGNGASDALLHANAAKGTPNGIAFTPNGHVTYFAASDVPTLVVSPTAAPATTTAATTATSACDK
ncbi:dual 3',5'-cyclic-AMP and -GMP phosphodiesterase 11 isoform X1 [Bactrocera neohumeralis]|uniref:dual 3',5'-cyclic-AMP and -GMP phosphodiesterase 11 isoform X1 n=2 Tax=Bactrocera neohumeralis TaxID=98809 RepID=UPI00216563F0|nr:dual 3',5'-cyclic-AMP and -GMP phosphodiesterase 11 isoform X1 [Bactrocera neohumeralis]XP_050320396.1 dual 3',5'-cyclic-AMP and -GMP phosphodiesterase 11 isoform X1 [Bactrocera neohumeralis]